MTRWVSGQKVWQTLLIRTALVNAFCLLLAFVVAMEFYLSAADGPWEISWREAAEGSLRRWFPWMLMSPLIVGLAGFFRFDLKRWRRNLLVHLAACLAFAIADESLLALTFPAPRGPFFGVAFAGPRGGRPGRGGGGFERGPGLLGSDPGRPFETKPFGPGDGPVPRSTNEMGGLPPMGNFNAMPGPPIGPGGPMFASGRGSWRDVVRRAMFSIQFAAPIYWWIVCGCWALSHFQESGERERRALELEARLNQANLQALKVQLQPHFLFNTLNAIATLIHENPRAADDMIGALSQFLRMCLDVSSQNEVPLQKELEFVNRYLDIQQIRFGGRLRIQREIDPAAGGAMVPPLLLQPLVENSIRHGIETRESGGLVTIRVQRHEEMLLLEVCDDGGGFTGRELLAMSEGIGLSNTKARLQALYGQRHQLRLVANTPAGARVSIEIPFRTNETPAGLQP
jgi:hypothetical protein